MVTGDGTCFATGFLTGNGLEKTSRRRRNEKTGFGVQRRENGREKGGLSTRSPVFPSTSRFSPDQCIHQIGGCSCDNCEFKT
jgi:hypothetical protein